MKITPPAFIMKLLQGMFSLESMATYSTYCYVTRSHEEELEVELTTKSMYQFA